MKAKVYLFICMRLHGNININNKGRRKNYHIILSVSFLKYSFFVRGNELATFERNILESG